MDTKDEVKKFALLLRQLRQTWRTEGLGAMRKLLDEVCDDD